MKKPGAPARVSVVCDAPGKKGHKKLITNTGRHIPCFGFYVNGSLLQAAQMNAIMLQVLAKYTHFRLYTHFVAFCLVHLGTTKCAWCRKHQHMRN